MTQSGDDCYFFYYSKCTKGALCPFRHQEAALGTETVCSLWKEGRCFKPVCSLRHMDIQKNRSHIPCYWEKQPGGCQKPHCVFLHAVPSKISAADTVKESTSILPVPDPSDWAAVKMMHVAAAAAVTGQAQRFSQELGSSTKDVPSPKVEQLVINPFEEESDQESINGTPQKTMQPEANLVTAKATEITNVSKVISLKRTSPEDGTTEAEISMACDVTVAGLGNRIQRTKGDSSLGIKTLEEIQREKALQSLLKNRSLSKVTEGLVTSDQQFISQTDVPVVRRVILTSETEVNVNPSKRLIKNGSDGEVAGNNISASSKIINGTILAPKERAGSNHGVKERLGLQSEDVTVGSPNRECKGERISPRSSATICTSRGVKHISGTSDSIVKRAAEPTHKNAINQPPQKICKVEKQQVVIKSLDEIKREKTLQQNETGKSKPGIKPSLRKTRPSLEIYQPPVRTKIGTPVCEPTADGKPLESHRTKGQKSIETKKSDSWLHVKTFAEIMKEKQKKKLTEHTDESKVFEISEEKSKVSEIYEASKRREQNEKLVNTKLQEDETDEAELEVRKEMCQVATDEQQLHMMQGVAAVTHDRTNVTEKTNGLQGNKPKFVPIVFDLEKKQSSKRPLSPIDTVGASKQVPGPVLKNVKLSNNSLIPKSDYKKSAVDSFIPNSERITTTTFPSDPAVVKVRRLSQKVSSGGAAQLIADKSVMEQTCSKDRLNKDQQSEEDDFTKQLDDLMVDINCVPCEDFPGLTDESQNDDDLLLEIQELLS